MNAAAEARRLSRGSKDAELSAEVVTSRCFTRRVGTLHGGQCVTITLAARPAVLTAFQERLVWTSWWIFVRQYAVLHGVTFFHWEMLLWRISSSMVVYENMNDDDSYDFLQY